MKDTIQKLTESFRRRHRAAQRYTAFLLAMALVVTLFVNWELHGDGIAVTADYQCGLEEHTHTADCYKKVLVCGYTEGEPEDDGTATMPSGDLEMDPGFGFGAEEDLLGQPIFEDEDVLTDDMTDPADTEVPVHHHTDACYKEVLVCPLPEHHHTVECLSDTTADVETEQDWEAATDLTHTGNWPEDLLRVAQSQLDYEQSAANFQLDADGHTVRHYTRYGQWYGNPYGAWDVMFLSYCLHYAGVPEDIVPQQAGVLALRSALHGSDWLVENGNETALQPGDIVFYMTKRNQETIVPDESDTTGEVALYEALSQTTTEADDTTDEETVGIVEQVDEELGTVTVISGDVDGRVAEVTLSRSEVTGIVALTQAYAAQTPAKLPETGSTETKKDEVPSEEDDGFQAGIDWIGPAPETEADFPVTLELADNEVELTDYITKAVFSKLVGSNWTEITEGDSFENGESVRVKLTYTLLQNVLGNGKNTVVYKLPGGLTLKKAKDDGVIYNAANERVGTYTISTDGEVRLTFTDPTVLSGAEFEGFFQFEAETDFSHAGEDGEVKFSKNFSLKIKKPTPDIAVTKGLTSTTGTTDSDNNFYLSWWVMASTQNGTFDEVRIGDRLNVNSNGQFAGDTSNRILGSYVPESIRVVKIVDGKETPVPSTEYTLNLSNADTSDFKSLEITGLPELKAGEQYKLYYQTKITPDELDKAAYGDKMLYNLAFAGVKDQPDVTLTKPEHITFNRRRIQKSVSYNQQTGLLDWTVTVRAPRDEMKGFLKDYVVKDVIPDNVTVKGDVTVRAGSGANANTLLGTISPEQLKNGYTISSSQYNVYTFTFSTTVPAAGTSVTNTATASKDDKTFSANASYTSSTNAWTVSKTRTGTVNGVATWNLVVNNPTGAASFAIIDVMDGKTNNIRVDGSHWAIASELQEAIENNLKLTLVDGTQLDYAQAKQYLTILYYADTAAKTQVDVTTSPQGRVLCFNILVNKTEGSPVRRVEVPGVPTHEDWNQVPVGDTRNYINILAVRNKATDKNNLASSTANDSYTRYESFIKEVSTNGTGDNNYNGGSTVDYDEVKDHKLRYRLTLNTDAGQKDPIVITDTLPQKVNDRSNIADFKVTLDGKDVTSTYKKSWSVENGVLEVTLSNYNTTGASHQIVVQYSVKIDADPRWKDLSIKSVEYTNAAKWGDEEASTTTTVTREVPVVAKSGEQLINAEGQPTNRIRYTVFINQAGETLNNGQDLTLEDQLSVVSGSSAYGDLSSVKLYYCNIVDGEPTIGDPLPTALYQVLPSTADSWLKMTIPDRTRLALQYECEIDPGNSNAPELSNQVSINGQWKSGISNQVNYDSSQASIQMGQLILNKMDKDSGRMLPGAEFTIAAYNKQTQTWQMWGTRTTDATGKITLGVTANGTTSLHPDILYRITETKAPTNYEPDDTPRYVLFASTGKDFDTAYQDATGTTGDFVDADGVTVAYESVNRGTASSTTILNIYNTYNQLTVHKLWLNSSNQQVTPEVDSIKVQLYRYTLDDPGQMIPVGDLVTLEAANNWSYTWSGSDVPTKINGQDCYYTVEEETTGSWNVVVRKNGDVQTGEITLCNVVYDQYELPSTGGSGTTGFALLGGALMTLSLVGGAVLAWKKRGKHE